MIWHVDAGTQLFSGAVKVCCWEFLRSVEKGGVTSRAGESGFGGIWDWLVLVGWVMGTKNGACFLHVCSGKTYSFQLSHFTLFLLLRSLVCDHCDLVRYWWGYSQDSKANFSKLCCYAFEILYENWALFYRSFFLYYCYTIIYKPNKLINLIWHFSIRLKWSVIRLVIS